MILKLIQLSKFIHKAKVKCTLVQALRICIGRTAHRGSRGIALLFLDHGTRRGEGSASRPGRYLPLGKTRYPLYRRLGGPQGRSAQVRKISPPPGFDTRTVQPVASTYTDCATRPTGICPWYTEKYFMNREKFYSVNNYEVVTTLLEEASLKTTIDPVPKCGVLNFNTYGGESPKILLFQTSGLIGNCTENFPYVFLVSCAKIIPTGLCAVEGLIEVGWLYCYTYFTHTDMRLYTCLYTYILYKLKTLSKGSYNPLSLGFQVEVNGAPHPGLLKARWKERIFTLTGNWTPILRSSIQWHAVLHGILGYLNYDAMFSQ